MKQKNRVKLKWVATFLVTWIFVHCVYISWDGLHDYTGNADIAIVLGNMVYGDSSLSPVLRGRVDKAYALYRKGRVKKLFVSGGKGEKYHVKEGDAMRRYLLAKGMKDEDIIVDNNGNNTYFTAVDFIQLDKAMHFSSAIVVSSFYHITRSKYILKKLGYKNVNGISSDDYFMQDVYGLLREFFAFYKYMLIY